MYISKNCSKIYAIVRSILPVLLPVLHTFSKNSLKNVTRHINIYIDLCQINQQRVEGRPFAADGKSFRVVSFVFYLTLLNVFLLELSQALLYFGFLDD